MASNYLFLTEPDDNLKCLICLEVASYPKQHGECGKLFCTECLEKNGNKPCPNCRDGNPQYFKDRRSLLEIKALPVGCSNVERVCDWEATVGTLDDHINKCGFILVSCPNKCKLEGEDLKLTRNYLDIHLNTICPNRAYQCVYCQKKSTYYSITEEHDSVCIKKVVSCPNTECTCTMERGLTKKHVETVCKYTGVTCKYASIGCSVKKMRQEIKRHEEDGGYHLPLILEKVMKLESKVEQLEDTISSLESTNTSSWLKKNVYTLSGDKSITFNIPTYSTKKENGVVSCSEPFYTGCGGYKMYIKIYPNGFGDRKGTHISVYSEILEGFYDDDLPWPFLGTVTVELLNQLADDNHHCKMIPFNIKHNKRVGNVWGYGTFIHHSELLHCQANLIQYLVEDTLYFKVTVTVDYPKPWLNCTHRIE